MAADRDIGVVVVRALRTLGGALHSGWEMTAATGVRGLRLANEAGPFDRFLLTESHPAAVEVLRANAARHRGVTVEAADARQLPSAAPFDYVDLDPYGSPVAFVPTALRAVRPGGVLAVTATDLMVLAGAQRDACRRHYGAEPVRGRLGPEGGLRILLAYLGREAEAAGRSLRPLLGYVRDHHLRAYVALADDTAPAEMPIGEIEPAHWNGPPVGDRGPYGPLWLGPLFSAPLVEALRPGAGLQRPEEVGRWVERLREESAVDVPFYYEANSIAGALGLARPPSLSVLLEALRSEGFRAARSHVRPAAFRTDAPRPVVEAVARSRAGT